MTITRDRSYNLPARILTDGIRGYDGPMTIWAGQVVPIRRLRTGTSLPHHQQVIDSGGNATTPLDATWDTIDERKAAYRVRSNPGGGIPPVDATVSGYLMTGNTGWNRQPLEPSIDLSEADNKARVKFFKNVRAQHTKFNGVTFLGELRESLHMIRHPAQALYKNADDYLKRVKKLKRQAPKDWSKRLGGLWLEHAFGWVPLLNDIKDGYAAYQEATKPSQGATIINGSYSDMVDSTNEKLNGPYAGFVNTSWFVGSFGGVKIYSRDTCTQTCVVRYRGQYRAQVEAPRVRNQRLFGFTPQDFVPAAWELLPWSFLIDYFTNFGDVVEASVTSLAGVGWVNKTIIKTCTVVSAGSLAVKVGDISSGAPVDIAETLSQDTYVETKRKRVNREANTGIDFPRVTFDTGLSRGQLGNIAALLTNGLTIHPQRYRRRFT